MTNALVVLWEVKVSEEAGTSLTPADMWHEDTGVLDATLPLSICKLAQLSDCQTFHTPPFGGRKKQKRLGPPCDVVYVLVRICLRRYEGSSEMLRKANGPLWMLVTLLLSPIQRFTASGHLPRASLHHGISAGTSPLRLTSSQSSSVSAEVK